MSHAYFFRWRIRPGREAEFEAAWDALTLALGERGSHGSALFRAEDGTYAALARWPDRATRERAGREEVDAALRERMHDAIAETLLVLPADEVLNRWVLPRR
ncbi:hypothetical protein [Parvularcula oceani]|uniref:hypothetical protein n=1 Tax=Parvularcula oceani TaxID=1247963 RepID=UPI0005635772|nr:hypothetical protein [Parvularcula oceani]